MVLALAGTQASVLRVVSGPAAVPAGVGAQSGHGSPDRSQAAPALPRLRIPARAAWPLPLALVLPPWGRVTSAATATRRSL